MLYAVGVPCWPYCQGWRHMVDVVGGTEPSSASEQRRRAVLVLTLNRG